MVKSRRLKRSRKSRSTLKRRMSKRRLSKRRMSIKRSMRYAKRGGLTCYDAQGWPDRKGYYNSNGSRNEDCPVTDVPSDDEDNNNDDNSWGKRRGY